MSITEDDVKEDFIKSARAVLVTGTHFSKPNTEAAQKKAIRIAKANGAKVIFDIDYRPNLSGPCRPPGGRRALYRVGCRPSRLKPVLAECDLIVGTEEEVLIASGEADLLAALQTIRASSSAPSFSARPDGLHRL